MSRASAGPKPPTPTPSITSHGAVIWASRSAIWAARGGAIAIWARMRNRPQLRMSAVGGRGEDRVNAGAHHAPHVSSSIRVGTGRSDQVPRDGRSDQVPLDGSDGPAKVCSEPVQLHFLEFSYFYSSLVRIFEECSLLYSGCTNANVVQILIPICYVLVYK